MSTITWLHLSDLHFRAETLAHWNADIVLQALLDDVRSLIGDKGLAPDLILVSGDVAYSGTPAEYELAAAFFDDLLAATALSKDRLFLVPGNHDVDRTKIGFVAQQLTATLTTRAAIDRLLSTADARQIFMVRFEGYAAFVNEYLGGHLAFDDEHYYYARTLELDGLAVTVLGLNSAWMAQGGIEDRHHLALGEWQVRAALEDAATADAPLTLALFHHPFGWLSDPDVERSEPLLVKACDFVLHGHLHRTGLTLQQTPDARGCVVAAGASYATRQSRNSYNLAQIDAEAGQGEIHLRAWSDQGGGFWHADTGTYHNVPDGVYHFAYAAPESGAPQVVQTRDERGRVIQIHVHQKIGTVGAGAQIIGVSGGGRREEKSSAGGDDVEVPTAPPSDQSKARENGESKNGEDEEDLKAQAQALADTVHIDPHDPPYAALRELLTDAFSAQELRQFCQERKEFRPVLSRFGLGHSQADMIDQLLEFCRTRLLWDTLVRQVAATQPAWFLQHASRLGANG